MANLAEYEEIAARRHSEDEDLIEKSAPQVVPRQAIRYLPLVTAVVVGVAATIGSFLFLRELAIELGASAFFVAYLLSVLSALWSRRFTPDFLRRHADQSDIPGVVILLVALGTVAVAAGSLFVLLNTAHPDRTHMALGLLSVVLGWLCIHTMFGFHYAYEYYGTDDASPVKGDGGRRHVGGLEFPGSDTPDGLSFLYFSFVVAMTAQVSDVQVTSNGMRVLVLLHGILSFFFNAVILAVAVNVIVSLGH